MASFDAVTVKPSNATDGSWKMQFTATGFTARRVLLQRMLRERFGLAAVEEKQERPVYLLEVSGRGARMGAALKETEAEKARGNFVSHMHAGYMEVTRISMDGLAQVLEQERKRTVVDRTGLAGRYAFTLQWTEAGDEETTWPALPEALEEQLGLRLTAAQSMVNVVTVSHVGAPTAD